MLAKVPMALTVLRRQLPNLLTVLRFPLTAGFLYGWVQPRRRWHGAALLAFLAAIVTDWYDGYLARRTHSESKVGAFLDPLADKVLTLSGFLAILYTPGFRWGRLKPVIFAGTIVIALREVGITVLRSRMVRGSSPLATSWWGKWKTSVQMGTLVTAFLGQITREILSLKLRRLEPLVAVGVAASAALASVSGLRYLKASRDA